MNKVKYYFNLCQQYGFPKDIINDEKIDGMFKSLKVCKASKYDNRCIKLIQHYHPSIWKCNKYGFKSPIVAWNDEKIMSKCIKNRLKYKGDILTIYDIRYGLSVSKLAPKVSVFRPSFAKMITEKYLGEFSTVFDPCCGFSGRMLGVCSCDKNYIGQDINSITVKECNRLRQRLNLSSVIMLKNSLYDSGEYECLFTCPPYGNKENWHQDIEELSADEWIDVCLKNYKCKRYVFVVDKTEKYKEYIKETINNNSCIGKNTEFIIVIDN